MDKKIFKVKVFDEPDSQAQYDRLEKPDETTFYVLTNGKIYYGSILMSAGGAGINVLKEAGQHYQYKEGQLYYVSGDGIYINNDGDNEAKKGLYYADSESHLTPIDSAGSGGSLGDIIDNKDDVFHSDDDEINREFTGDDNTLMTSAAIVNLIKAILKDYVTYTYNDDSIEPYVDASRDEFLVKSEDED